MDMCNQGFWLGVQWVFDTRFVFQTCFGSMQLIAPRVVLLFQSRSQMVHLYHHEGVTPWRTGTATMGDYQRLLERLIERWPERYGGAAPWDIVERILIRRYIAYIHYSRKHFYSGTQVHERAIIFSVFCCCFFQLFPVWIYIQYFTKPNVC